MEIFSKSHGNALSHRRNECYLLFKHIDGLHPHPGQPQNSAKRPTPSIPLSLQPCRLYVGNTTAALLMISHSCDSRNFLTHLNTTQGSEATILRISAGLEINATIKVSNLNFGSSLLTTRGLPSYTIGPMYSKIYHFLTLNKTQTNM